MNDMEENRKTIDFEQIMAEWAQLKVENASLQRKNDELLNNLMQTRVVSRQQRLARNYRIGYFGFVFPLLAWGMYEILNISVALSVIYSTYGIAIGIFDLWFMHFIKDADYTSLPTIDALSHATKIVEYQNWFTVLSILLCVAILIPLFQSFSVIGPDVVVGGIIGGIVGGIIGMRKCIINHRLARRMKAELRSVAEM